VAVPELAERAEPGIGELLAEHGPVLLTAARLITLDADEAHDIVQAAFEVALRQGHTLRDPGAMRSWLLTIVTRQALKHVGWRRRLRPWSPVLHDVAVSPRNREDRMVLRAALAALPPRVRGAIALHYLEGYTVRDTAAVMGVSENTIKTQLQTGLARLRRELDDE